MNKAVLKASEKLSKVALAITSVSVNSIYSLFLYQEKLSEGAKKISKYDR